MCWHPNQEGLEAAGHNDSAEIDGFEPDSEVESDHQVTDCESNAIPTIPEIAIAVTNNPSLPEQAAIGRKAF
jgi:hypothetical protein